MPRKKKPAVNNFEKNHQIAVLIYKILTDGSRAAKAEVISRLIIEDQIDFLEEIKVIIGLKEYYRVVEVC